MRLLARTDAPTAPARPPAPASVPLLRESDLVTAAGAIDRAVLMRIAAARARGEFLGYAAIGAPRPWRTLLAEELARTWSLARLLAESAAARRAVAALPPSLRRLRRLELRLEILRRGLATPPRDRAARGAARGRPRRRRSVERAGFASADGSSEQAVAYALGSRVPNTGNWD